MLPLRFSGVLSWMTLCAVARAAASEGNETAPPAPSSEVAPPIANVVEEPAVPAPAAPVAIESVDLGELLGRNIRGGEVGSYGVRLSEYGMTLELHGYLTFEYKQPLPELSTLAWSRLRKMTWPEREKAILGGSTFDLHHATLATRASLGDRVFAEMAFEWEHAGKEFYIPWGFADLKAFEWLVLRAGLFPVPIGVFNEYLYPDFLRKTAQAPLMSKEIIPSIWPEVGAQLRGRLEMPLGSSINYALYIVNGLESRIEEHVEAGGAGEETTVSTGDHSGEQFNARDINHPDKAFGGRLGLTPMKGIDIGISGYTGAYVPDGDLRMSYVDADVTVEMKRLHVRWEAVVGHHQLMGRLARGVPLPAARLAAGTYLLTSYELTPMIEPYVQGDLLSMLTTTPDAPSPRFDTEGGKLRMLTGVLFRPFPQIAPGTVIKGEGSVTLDQQGGLSLFTMGQLAIGL